jgi:PAS domain S-box-containing protein
MLTPTGEVATWNAGSKHVLGYYADEIIGRHFSCFFPKNDVDANLPAEILAEAGREERSEREGWQLRKDGSRFWANTVVHAATRDGGELIGFSLVTRDVTERMVAQDALYESERRFRLLVEGVTDYAIYMLDPSGIITNWNAGAQRMKGYVGNEIVGQHFSKFYSREDRASGLPARVLDTAAREGRYEAEGWRYRKDGSRFWASVVVDAIRGANGDLVGFGKVTRDISERRVAQEALRESERQFRMLVEGVRDYALYMLDPNGIVSSWNTGAQRIKGYSAWEIIGQHFSRFYSEADRAAGTPARALDTAIREGRFEAEGWRLRKDGTMFWANAIIDPIRDEKGNLVGFAKITRDITERKEAEVALREAQSQRNQAQKMEALGHLTGGVAHDFNNLLMIISGQNQVLKRLAADNPKGLRSAEAIEMAIGRGASLTRQLLTFSRRQTLNPKVIELEPHIQSFKTMLQGTMGGMTILSSVLPGTWPVKVDPHELELALLNLSINARDAMPNGGAITISVENMVLKHSDTSAGLDGDFVAITVSDTGTGIAPDIVPKIFDPFFTTKQNNKGSGLGLSQVHGFTHQSGGTVTIESELGRGTRIALFLPRSMESTELQEIIRDGDTAGSGRILLVEDDPEVAEATRVLLRNLGYDVTHVDNGIAALNLVFDSNFVAVLSDIIMAGELDGIALAQKIHERLPGLPIILVTGYSNRAGLDANTPVLRKPYNAAELGRALRAVIAGREAKADNLVRFPPPISTPRDDI